MHWVAPSEKDSSNGSLEKRLWESADQFRANSGLKPQEYSGPILGIIFLNPRRHVGVARGETVSDEDFKEQLETLNEELEAMNAQARELEQTIARNVAEILEA